MTILLQALVIILIAIGIGVDVGMRLVQAKIRRHLYREGFNREQATAIIRHIMTYRGY